MIIAGADINSKTSIDNFTPLIISSSSNQPEIVKRLLEQEDLIFFDENQKPIMGALHVACYKGNKSIIFLLKTYLNKMHEWSFNLELLSLDTVGYNCLHYSVLGDCISLVCGDGFREGNDVCKGFLVEGGKEKVRKCYEERA